VANVQIHAEAAGAAFFFKQWGGWGADGVKRHKKANGRIFRGRTWDGYPEAVAHP
jgi:protein gp37